MWPKFGSILLLGISGSCKPNNLGRWAFSQVRCQAVDASRHGDPLPRPDLEVSGECLKMYNIPVSLRSPVAQSGAQPQLALHQGGKAAGGLSTCKRPVFFI